MSKCPMLGSLDSCGPEERRTLWEAWNLLSYPRDASRPTCPLVLKEHLWWNGPFVLEPGRAGFRHGGCLTYLNWSVSSETTPIWVSLYPELPFNLWGQGWAWPVKEGSASEPSEVPVCQPLLCLGLA